MNRLAGAVACPPSCTLLGTRPLAWLGPLPVGTAGVEIIDPLGCTSVAPFRVIIWVMPLSGQVPSVARATAQLPPISAIFAMSMLRKVTQLRKFPSQSAAGQSVLTFALWKSGLTPTVVSASNRVSVVL